MSKPHAFGQGITLFKLGKFESALERFDEVSLSLHTVRKLKLSILCVGDSEQLERQKNLRLKGCGI